jgi:hypothetical protein
MIESAESVPLAVVLVAMFSTARGLHIGRGPEGGARVRRAINTHVQHACSAHAQAPFPRDVLFLGLCVIVSPACPAVVPFPASIIYPLRHLRTLQPPSCEARRMSSCLLDVQPISYPFSTPSSPFPSPPLLSNRGCSFCRLLEKEGFVALPRLPRICYWQARRRKKHLSPVSTRPPARSKQLRPQRPQKAKFSIQKYK